MKTMNRTIRHITENLTGLLPDDQQYYKLEDLRSWGFPVFIVNRIQIELEHNLAESMRLPETDWANMQSAAVQNIWQQFVKAIRDEAWLPASYAKPVIETAVADVLEILVQPRKNLPEVIFGADKKLTADQVKERVNVLVVYRHFASLLSQYMKKKGLEDLTKERCSIIIEKADEKITARYTPLNWAQMLEPLFNLLSEQIDSSLLRLFFEDKKMPRIARKFDLMDQRVNRAMLIETLSSPESLNLEGYEEDQSDLFEAAESKKPSGSAERQELNIEDKESRPEEQEGPSLAESPPENPMDLKEDEAKDNNEGFDEETLPSPLSNKSSESRAEFQHEETPLNTIFEDDASSEPEEYVVDQEETGVSLNDNFEETEDEPQKSEVDLADEEEPTEPDSEEEHEFETQEDLIENNETPMWQRFMSPEELQSFTEEEEESNYDVGFIEEPIFDATTGNEPNEHDLSTLQDHLEDERKYFVEEIFRGSERAYDEALEEIVAKENWRSASRYIEKEVFQRNLVDMYSEAAVDFTDRLQNYFIKKN